MSVKKFVLYGLMITGFSAPGLISPDTITIHESKLSAVLTQPCYVRQPDLLVGTVSYQKGLTMLNGIRTAAGAYLRNGDTITTAVDGFVAIELANGTRVSIQPYTLMRVTCSGFATQGNSLPPYTIDEPHTLGAIRG